LYAIKANPCPAVVRTILAEGFGIDAVSPGEVALALALACPAHRVVYTENNMTDAEMATAAAQGVLINCGSLDRLERLGRAGVATAAVRFNPDVGGGEHDHVITAGPLTKFGVHHAQLDEVLAIEQRTGIRVVGAHMHIGSNILDAAIYARAMAVITGIAVRLPHLAWVDVGGGLGVPYRPEQQPIDLTAVGAAAGRTIADIETAVGRDLELRLEPGRFLVAEAGTLLTSVTSVKRNPDGRIYVGCDSGFNHLVRPTMYGSWHPITNLSRNSPAVPQDIVGNICESGDVFARQRELPACKVGDVLAIGVAGAYGMSMASTYNLRPLPPELVADGGALRMARPRQSLDEVLRQLGV
jgi:diaminopimelate decarboxylase